ncbi:hypothetical protein [Pseudonocardia charpentierae]|uniref:Uncharacterized protein n=1 Tax=Pseudonocardia charpentierae TaxID=3075545 RepID=A0ABU2NHE3_9PSEU|nr:hypothetical protein [Pseudonocardia sp. DSM 45834]MDT0353370.1 hypothetical protein [Pseudonocardia sp. DSM 45834]
MDLELVANFLGAGGNVAAVITALFLAVYPSRRSRPRLGLCSGVIDGTLEGSEDNVLIQDPDHGIVEYWIRLRVCAAAGKRTARNVQCRVASVTPLSRPASRVIPSGPLNWSSIGPEPQSILSGSWLRVDLLVLYVEHPQRTCGPRIAIGYSFDKGEAQIMLEPGRYEVRVHLGSDDVPTSLWSVELEYLPDAKAISDADIRSQIRLTRLERLR